MVTSQDRAKNSTDLWRDKASTIILVLTDKSFGYSNALFLIVRSNDKPVCIHNKGILEVQVQTENLFPEQYSSNL